MSYLYGHRGGRGGLYNTHANGLWGGDRRESRLTSKVSKKVEPIHIPTKSVAQPSSKSPAKSPSSKTHKEAAVSTHPTALAVLSQAKSPSSNSPHKTSALVGRTKAPATPSPEPIPRLELGMCETGLLQDNKGDLSLSRQALEKFAQALRVPGANEATTWAAFNQLNRTAPFAVACLNNWLQETFGTPVPQSASDPMNKVLRSDSGVALVGQLVLALKEMQSNADNLKKLAALHGSFRNIRDTQQQLKCWQALPRDLQGVFSGKVWEISGSPSINSFGRSTIEGKPSVLFSLKGQNLLQEQVNLIEGQLSSTLYTHLLKAKQACLNSILKVDTSQYAQEHALAREEIAKLGHIKKFLSSNFDNGNIQMRNAALREFLGLSVSTTEALQHLVWIAAGKPEGDFDYGLHSIEREPRLLCQISEEQLDGSLLDWATEFFEGQIQTEKAVCTLEALETAYVKGRYTPDTLKWLFANSDEELIQQPLLQLLQRQGITREMWEENPRHLVTPPAASGDPSPIQILITAYKAQLATSIHDYAKNAVKIQEGLESGARVEENITVERFVAPSSQHSEQILKRYEEAQSIALITPEYSKLYDAGGLAPAMHGLAKSLAERGQTVKVIMPFYHELLPKAVLDAAQIKPEYAIRDGTKDGGRCNVMKVKMKNAEVAKFFGLKDLEGADSWAKNLSFYLIAPENKEMFKKGYGGSQEIRRFAYFQSAAVELLNKLNQRERKDGRKKIDVFQANDWGTSLIAQGLQVRYPESGLRSVFAVHNSNYHPVIDGGTMEWARLQQGEKRRVDTVVQATLTHDQTVTVSRNYAREIQTRQLGVGLDPFFRYAASNGRLNGIVNGNNTAMHNPATDASLRGWKDIVTDEPIDLTYSAVDTPERILEQKAKIKEQLQAWFDLHYPEAHMNLDPNKPLFFYVGRLVDQKGLDIIEPMIEKIIAEGGQFVAVGMGGVEMEATTKAWLLKAKKRIEGRFGKAGAAIILDEWTEHKVTKARVRKYQQGDGEIPGMSSLLRSATDIFLMPSKFEPCGLTQGEAKRYGTTLTVATHTGGLVDTEITPQTSRRADKKDVTAFLCPRVGNYGEWHKPAQMRAFVQTIGDALQYYRSHTELERAERMKYVMDMSAKSSWTETPDGSRAPADEYRLLYSAAQVLPRQTRRIGPRLHIPKRAVGSHYP